MKYLFKKNEKTFEGFQIEETIKVPISRGLGSSATAILAGFFAANKYLGDPYSEKELLIKLEEKVKYLSNMVYSEFKTLSDYLHQHKPVLL